MIEKLKEYYARGITKNFDFRYLSLEKLENSILYYYHDIIDAFKQDLNKGEFDTITTEIGMVLNEIRYFKSKLPTLMYPKKVKTGLFNHPSKGYIYPEPYGVVLIASPWNYPFNLALSPLVGAIAAGNTICIKADILKFDVTAVNAINFGSIIAFKSHVATRWGCVDCERFSIECEEAVIVF